jgi:hypothetical protein
LDCSSVVPLEAWAHRIGKARGLQMQRFTSGFLPDFKGLRRSSRCDWSGVSRPPDPLRAANWVRMFKFYANPRWVGRRAMQRESRPLLALYEPCFHLITSAGKAGAKDSHVF